MNYRIVAGTEGFTAVTPEGAVAGRGSLAGELHGIPQQPGQLFLTLAVEEAHRGRGVGSALYRALEEAARNCTLACSVAAADEASLRFATRRGFRFDYQILDAELDLTGFDPSPWAGAVEAAEARGVRFTTLAEAPHLLPDLYRLDQESSADVPEWSGIMPPYDRYAADMQGGDPAGVIIALKDGRPTGFMFTGDNGYTHFLCVRRSSRGKGIAVALKLLTIDWARRKGLTSLITNNNATNAPMLALNRKLGYTTRPGTIYLVKPPIK